ncbi:MAG: transposase [Elusimicrobiota bacterium]
MSAWQLWREDKAAVVQEIEMGKDLGGHNSAFGDNDLIVGFLMVEGFWSVLVGTEADGLKKENGYPARILNGLWALCELAGVERIAQSGKVLGDEALLRMVGFQAEQIEAARAQGRLRVDPETLANHLGRISKVAVDRSWWEHVKLLKSKRWYRGGVYAVDGTMITIPYGQADNYEGAGKMGEACGYRLVVVLNIDEGHERVVGWALGPLARSEKALLGEIFKQLREQFGRLGDWMKVLVMDRGYWGSAFLESIKRDEGVDYVTRAGNDELDIVSDVDGMSRLESTVWHEATEEHSRLGKMRVRMAGFQDVPMFDDNDVDHGPCQVVIAEEHDMQGQRLPERPRFHYVTSLPVDPASAETVQAVRTYYRRRWSVENQGFWVLTKRWNLDTLVARNLNAIRARLNFALQLYNAENCCAWKHPGRFQEELPRLKRPPKGERLGKASIMVYTPEGQVGAFQAREFKDLVTTAVKTQAKDHIRKGLAEGRTLDEILRDL